MLISRLRDRSICQAPKRLTQSAISGMSPTNLRKCREFYQCYEKIQQTLSVTSLDDPEEIQQTVSVTSQLSQVVSGVLPVKTLDNQMIISLLSECFSLSWSP